MMKKKVSLIIMILFFNFGCVSTQQNKTIKSESNIYFKLSGKIVFIDDKKNKKQSLNIFYEKTKKSVKLKLNTFLGINVLSLYQQENQVKIITREEKYIADNLNGISERLIGINIPIVALENWLIAKPYFKDDRVIYSDGKLNKIISYYDNNYYEINYKKNKEVNGVYLPKLIEIKTYNKRVKIKINSFKNL
jgi:outer membrane lipoprotein LolB